MSINELHNIMQGRYGYFEEKNGISVTRYMKEDVDYLKLQEPHLTLTGRSIVNNEGQKYVVYFVIRGSHTYNTAEMSRLIDDVISEAKDLDIDV